MGQLIDGRKGGRNRSDGGTPPKFNIAPEKWWFPVGISFSSGLFSGAMLVSGRVLSFTLEKFASGRGGYTTLATVSQNEQ